MTLRAGALGSLWLAAVLPAAGCVAGTVSPSGEGGDGRSGDGEGGGGAGPGEAGGAGDGSEAGSGAGGQGGAPAGGQAGTTMGGSGGAIPPAGPPNVLVILTDDQGCGDFGFMGNTKIKTPTMDRLAREGTLFTNFHTMAVCAPTRAGLMTGRAHQRTGVRGNVRGDEFMQGTAETTVAEMFRKAGYKTAAFGKWHLGETYPSSPHGQGFDEYLGMLGGSAQYFDQDLRNETGGRTSTRGHVTDVLTAAAIDFIATAHAAKQPFMIYLPYNAPHDPLEEEKRYLDMYAGLPSTTREAYAMITHVDDGIARILAKLDELGIEKNTLVLLAGDNGPQKGFGALRDDTRFNCGLRGQKKEIYEGGIRNPLVLRQPDTIPAGKKIGTATSVFDVLPTLADYAGLDLPATKLDGRSMVPLIDPLAKDGDFPARTVYLSMQTTSDSLTGSVAIEGKYKLVDGAELFDLEADPGESKNLSATSPEIVSRLRAGLSTWWADVYANRADPAAVELGHPEEPTFVLTPNAASKTAGLMFRWNQDNPAEGGQSLRSHFNWLGDWKETSDELAWSLKAVKAATYEVVLHVRCRSAGSLPFSLDFGGKVVRGTIGDCYHSDMRWVPITVGPVSLPAGSLSFTLRATAPGPDVELRDIDIVGAGASARPAL